MSSGQSAGCKVAVFARAPVAGQCKTRLIPRLGPEGAAQLQANLTLFALETAIAAAVGPVELWCSPDRNHEYFAECARIYGIVLRTQQGGDLGARMNHAFTTADAAMLLMGTDSPSITASDIQACAAALSDVDAVFLPAEDGGYGLTGLNQPMPEIFLDMVWSTPDVMDESRRRLQRAGKIWREIRTVWDVDEPDDYERLVESGLIKGLL